MTLDQRMTLLALVRQEVEANLGKIADAATRHQSARPGNDEIASCEALAHQVHGALRMVQLPGVARVAGEVEAALRAATRSAAADKAEIAAIGRATATLSDFINDVAGGGAYIPCRLFPAYRELARIAGNDAVSEKDLFFPDLEDRAPLHARARAITQSVIPVLVKDMRVRYQRGLLAWLKEPASPAGLKQIRDVLDGMHQLATQMPPPRGLWWAGVTLTDSVMELLPEPKAAEWLPRVKTAFSRLDFLLRDLAAGGRVDTLPAQRDVYYAIATCRVPTARLADACHLLNIEGMVGGTAVADTRGNQPLIDDAMARLNNIKEIWTEYVAGEPKRLTRFRELLAAVTQKARELGNLPLTQLLLAIHAATASLPDPYPLDGQALSLEMASALLMAEDILAHYHDLPADLEQQTGIMKDWLTAAAAGAPASGAPIGLRADIVQKVNDAKLRAATAREINKSLQQVEKAVEAYARDGARRDGLLPLPDILRQVRGVFEIFNEKRAAQLTLACQRLIERCANGSSGNPTRDVEWLAEGLGSLGFYLEPSLQGKLPAERAINLFFARHEKQQGFVNLLNVSQPIALDTAPAAAAPAVAVATSPAPVVAAPPQQADSTPPPVTVEIAAVAPAAAVHANEAEETDEAADREMLDIFLDEATEVLDAMAGHIIALYRQLGDHDALISTRRAFHTLKGSSRMVGLTAFGECAWEMEQLMNGWLAQGQAATTDLVKLIDDARALLAEWTYALRGERAPAIDGTDIGRRAQVLRGVTPAPAPAAAVPPHAPAAVAAVDSRSVSQLLASADLDAAHAPAATAPAAAAESPAATVATAAKVAEELGERLKVLRWLLGDVRAAAAAAGHEQARTADLARKMDDSLGEAVELQQRLQRLLAGEQPR